MPVRPLDWNFNVVFAYSSKFFGEFDQLFFGKMAAQLGVKLLAHRHKGQPLLF